MTSDIVSQFAKAGWRIFPLNGKKPDLPKGTDWRHIPKDPTLSRLDILGNYALHCEDVLVIDIDVKKDAPGKESFRKLSEDAGLEKNWESKSLLVKTGTGGYHVYLNVPQGSAISLYHPSYPGIEFRYGPFYVVGPESIHPETFKSYDIVSGSIDALLDCPSSILDRITKKKIEKTGAQPSDGFVDDDPLNIDRYKEYLASMPVIPKGEGQTNSLYVVACRGRDFGLSRHTTHDVIVSNYNSVKLVPAVETKEIEHVVRSAYKYAKEKAGSLNVGAIFKATDVGEQITTGPVLWDTSARSGALMKTLNNAVNHIITLPHVKDAFRYNAFSGMIEINSAAPWYKERGSKGPNLSDEDIVLLKYFLTRTARVEYSQQTVLEAVIVAGHKRHYHPVRNYLNALVWDGRPRIDTWLTEYGRAIDTAYTRAIGRKTLCAGVRRVMQPGCKWDHVLIIEGAQGIGKSTACRILGRNWSGDMNLDPHNKDSIMMMLNKWVIELSELSALNWGDANAMKSFLTRSTDTVRLPYDRHAKDFPRQNIMIATCNPEHVGYLKDVTGNRRYWMVRFNGMVKMRELEDNCDQLWAEARAVYENEVLYLTGEAEATQATEAQARMPEDPMRTSVNRWIRENADATEVSTEQILEYIGVPMKSITRSDQSRVAQALCEIGWEKHLRRDDSGFHSVYEKPMRDQMDALMRSI
jgi:predicted P-loop ATPase